MKAQDYGYAFDAALRLLEWFPDSKYRDKAIGVRDAASVQLDHDKALEEAMKKDDAVHGVKEVGGSVVAPKVLKSVEPEFSDQARKRKISGFVLLSMVVDEQGRPTNVVVLRGAGYGLDENALAAVQQYRFAPGTEAGLPVKVRINVEVSFQVFRR